MKKKIIIGLGIYSILFLLGGVYILKTIHDATEKLDNLIMLHQVEILREHYLIQINKVQKDLMLTGTPHAPDFDTVVSHVRNMGNVIDTCFDCHHTPDVLARIRDLKEQTEDYTSALSRVITTRASQDRLNQEAENAFHVGEELVSKVSQMIAVTAARLGVSTRNSLEEIGDTKYVLYLLIGIGPLVSAALGFLFASGLTKPVNVLLNSTRRLKGGDLDHRVSGLKHEFGELADAFNEMAASLREQMLKIQRTQKLAALGELSAGLAHEIKNPLAGIKVAMHVLADEAELVGEDRSVVLKVSEEVTRLEMLMKTFLNFARPPKPQPTEVDINTLLSTTLTFYGTTRRASSNRVNGIETVRDLGEIPPMITDPMQIQQVVLNLLINAIDAMPDGGTLRLRTALDDGVGPVRIEISDTGKGIEREHADKIFEPFFTTKRGGTGLGLAISRQLIEQQGGSIAATENSGGGTTFTILLPLNAAEQSPAA